MKIAGLQKVTLLDYPGQVAATLFLAGCNLRCGYCHNRWMIDAANVTPALSVEQFLAWLGGRQGLLDAVCVSGGEPTLWGNELAALARAIRALGFRVKLDTNGLRPDVVAALLDERLLDYVAMDLKAPLDERYARQVGCPVDLDRIRATMALLREHAATDGLQFEFRTTVAPPLGVSDLPDLASAVLPDELWYLQAYVESPQVDPAYRGQAALSQDDLARLAAELRTRGWHVAVRGEG